MIRVVALVAACLATQANALSCLAPDATQLYTQAAESEEVFEIVTGRLKPRGKIKVPAVDVERGGSEKAQVTTRVWMSGKVLGAEDFDRSFNQRIDVTVSCLSIWCGNPIIDREILAALRITDDKPVLEIGPCGGMAMPLESADVDGLLACHRSGKCGIE